MVSLLKNKFILLYNSDSLVSSLPHNFKYIPKIKFQIGVNNDFFKNQNFNINNCNALVTTHPLKGLDWLLDIWINIISLKIPGQKCISILILCIKKVLLKILKSITLN